MKLSSPPFPPRIACLCIPSICTTLPQIPLMSFIWVSFFSPLFLLYSLTHVLTLLSNANLFLHIFVDLFLTPFQTYFLYFHINSFPGFCSDKFIMFFVIHLCLPRLSCSRHTSRPVLTKASCMTLNSFPVTL